MKEPEETKIQRRRPSHREKHVSSGSGSDMEDKPPRHDSGRHTRTLPRTPTTRRISDPETDMKGRRTRSRHPSSDSDSAVDAGCKFRYSDSEDDSKHTLNDYSTDSELLQERFLDLNGSGGSNKGSLKLPLTFKQRSSSVDNVSDRSRSPKSQCSYIPKSQVKNNVTYSRQFSDLRKLSQK